MDAPAAGHGLSATRGHLVPLLREIGDLKRITSSGRQGSIAERAFRRAWAALVAGQSPRDVSLATTAICVAATRMGDLDTETMMALGLSRDEALDVGREALRSFADVLPPGLVSRLVDGIGLQVGSAAGRDEPSFVDALAGQPRAGITCPGRARIVLQPAENHAEHCAIVAVYAVLLAEEGADGTTAFLASLAHHLHNAAMPDAGFTGEMLLGAHLGPVMERATRAALDELDPRLRATVESALVILPDASTPEGRAFHAADVLDRVLEIEQHLMAAELTMDTVLGEMALVHEGPVKGYHDGVLSEMGLG